jgi:hypothetical protein
MIRIGCGNPQFKAEQIKERGAEVVLAPCHNGVDQIRDLSEDYDLGIKAIHFKEAIVKTMDIPDEVIPFVGGGIRRRRSATGPLGSDSSSLAC